MDPSPCSQPLMEPPSLHSEPLIPSERSFSYDAWRLLALIVGVCGLVVAAMYAFRS
jgi:uncharacterized membrane protein